MAVSVRSGGRPRSVTVYAAGSDGYHTFRIPAVVAARDGTLLAFAEGRRTGSADAGPIDLVLRRSDDGGSTWGRLQVVSPGGDDTVGNPSPVVAPGTGDVVLLTTRAAGAATEERILRGDVGPGDGRRVWHQHSPDHGATWTAPVDVTQQVKRPDWRWYATGPGHAIALAGPPYTGRIVVAANHSTPETGYGGHLLLSDDGGRTWRIGAVDSGLDGRVKPNETMVAELADGRVYANTRNQGGTDRSTRAQATSRNGGETLDRPYEPAPALVAPVVQCSVLLSGGNTLVFAGPSLAHRRRRMVLRVSRDAGRTWSRPRLVWPGPAAYSDLVDLGGGDVGVLFENGDDGPYERISFARPDS